MSEAQKILWSNEAYVRYSGPALKGFTLGEGYMSQALRIAASADSFHNTDVEKAARILKATRQAKLMEQGVLCERILEERKA